MAMSNKWLIIGGRPVRKLKSAREIEILLETVLLQSQAGQSELHVWV